MRWITRAGWPGNLLAMAAGALATLSLSPFDLWPLALLSNDSVTAPGLAATSHCR